MVWWSLRYDHWKIPLDPNSKSWAVKLYTNRAQGAYVCVQVAAVITAYEEIGYVWDGSLQYGPEDVTPWFARGSLSIYGVLEHPRVSLNSHFEYHITNENAGALPCRQLVSSWLHTCATQHNAVCKIKDAKYPTRLIEVSAKDCSTSLRLITTPARTAGKYIALSYCWGRGSTLRLQSDNIEALHKSINISSLPQTIQDAISLVRFLGIRYLWVDALCIMQGQGEAAVADWTRESRLMHKVYGGAWLTIMAASGASSDVGLFNKRSAQDELCGNAPRIPVDSDRLEHAVFGPAPKLWSLSKEPLETRGWAFQEAILSKRQLKYGTSGMTWKCRSCEYHENVSKPVKVNNITSLQLTLSPLSRKGVATQLHDKWTEVVESYSQTRLTCESDKLPAISGLAETIRKQRSLGFLQHYHFGLWGSMIRQQLLWKHNGRIVNEHWRYQRQTDYRAPSWSWASVDGAVQFLEPGPLARSVAATTLNVWGSSIVFFGKMARAPSLRLQIRSKSSGLVEAHKPWQYLDSYFEMYLDDIESIPEKHKKTPDNEPHELIDAWLLFLKESQGLILLACDDDWAQWKRVLSTPLSLIASCRLALGLLHGSSELDKSHASRLLGPRFRRIGVFSGTLSSSAEKMQILTGQII